MNKCPTCGKSHQAYNLFPPACQYPNDRYTYFVDGTPAFQAYEPPTPTEDFGRGVEPDPNYEQGYN